ncbi:DEAD/DEAH box helicase [bacterium]|nr:DEAD/DEAH box helicase [bacterium]
MPHRPVRGHHDRGAAKKDKPDKNWHSEFQKLHLPDEVLAGIQDLDFTEMTPIQREALPTALAGEDLIGQAQTGTGKTATFLIAMMTQILRAEQQKGEKLHDPRGFILSPTRELAIQTHKEAVILGRHTGLRFGVFYGGKDYRRQERSLEDGIDVAIGTPGRMLDFMRQNLLRVNDVQFLVIDEADRLLDMGFYEELNAILRRLPKKEERQSLMFSATFEQKARKLATNYMNRPSFVEIEPENITAEGIDEKLFHVDRDEKFRLLLGILQRVSVDRGMIFANTKLMAGFITEKLKRNGFEAGLLTGDLTQNKRLRVLEDFKNGKFPLLVCSDVASRGLHIDDVSHIINYDVPSDAEDYVHRIGRTARVGKTGVAYTLACDEYVYNLAAIEKYIQRHIPSDIPDENAFAEDMAANYDIRAHKRHERSLRHKDGGAGHGGRGRPRSGGRPGGGGGGGRSRSGGSRRPRRS